LAFGVWRLAFGVWSLEFGVWSLEFGVWSLEFGVWSLEFFKKMGLKLNKKYNQVLILATKYLLLNT